MRETILNKKIIEPSLVYAYEFNVCNYVYVGRCLMSRFHKRHLEHTRGSFAGYRKTNDGVYNFGLNNNIIIPEPIILETRLSLIDSLEKEEYYILKYKDSGWNIINKAKCGIKSGSVGSLSHGIWNYENSYKEALKYKYKCEFLKNNPTVYHKALKNKWIDDYYWLIDKNKECERNYDECRKSALKYKTKIDFSKGDNNAYTASIRHGWIDTFDWFENGRSLCKLKYNFDECKEIAKKCKNRYEFQQVNKSAYERAWKEGWLDSFFGPERAKCGFYDVYENVYNVAKKYEFVGDFRREHETVYQKARKNKWIETFTWLKRKSSNQYIKKQ